jgi:nucleolar protein 9
MFLNSVLSELRGQELAVSTDPDTAVVLERLMPSLGDWGRRVIGDAFGDSWDVLIRHRFGSHVAQTWFTLAADTLDREVRPVLIVNQDCF